MTNDKITSIHLPDEDLIALLYIGDVSGTHAADCVTCRERLHILQTNREMVERNQLPTEDVSVERMAAQRRSIYARISARVPIWSVLLKPRWISAAATAIVLGGGTVRDAASATGSSAGRYNLGRRSGSGSEPAFSKRGAAPSRTVEGLVRVMCLQSIRILCLAVAVAVLPSGVLAQNRPDFPWWNSPVVSDLKLSPEQSQKIRQIVRSYRSRLLDARNNAHKAEGDLEDLFNDQDVNPESAKPVLERLANARANSTHVFLEMSTQVRAVLTLDQWRQLVRRWDEVQKKKFNDTQVPPE